jgi:hypothetical protein
MSATATHGAEQPVFTEQEGCTMSLMQIKTWDGSLPQSVSDDAAAPHGWERAVSRRGFMKAAAGVTGAVLGADLWLPALAQADAAGGTPKPIPEAGIGPFHVFFPVPNVEPITITDFNGFIGVAHNQGMATNTTTGERLIYDTDMRFMDGVYRGTDGKTHQGTFGFI